jgi:hypothetical protein
MKINENDEINELKIGPANYTTKISTRPELNSSDPAEYMYCYQNRTKFRSKGFG